VITHRNPYNWYKKKKNSNLEGKKQNEKRNKAVRRKKKTEG
jgi:hypothetical protein